MTGRHIYHINVFSWELERCALIYHREGMLHFGGGYIMDGAHHSFSVKKEHTWHDRVWSLSRNTYAAANADRT